MVVVSVAVLLAGFGSLAPLGRVIVAVLDRTPLAEELTFPVALQVTELVAGKVSASLILPVPLAVNPEAPAVPVAVKVTAVKIAGKLSTSVAPVALLGPALLTLIV